MNAGAFFHRINRDDVRMVELGKRFSLAAKARQPLGIACHLRGKHFERDVAAKLRVGGAIDFSHAACAQRGLNFIGTEFCAGS